LSNVSHTRRRLIVVLAAAAGCLMPGPLGAAETAAPYRQLAPGVMITIPPDRQEEETVSKHDVVEILRGIPGLEWKPKLSPDSRTLFQMASSRWPPAPSFAAKSGAWNLRSSRCE
jgi:hypothetical protein